MAVLALKPRHLPSVRLRKLAPAFYNIGDEELVLLYETEVMTLLADYVSVFPPLPFLEGLLHHMARHAELGVLLRVAVILVSDDNAEDRDSNDQGKNKTLQMIDEPFDPFCQPVAKISFHIPLGGLLCGLPAQSQYYCCNCDKAGDNTYALRDG